MPQEVSINFEFPVRFRRIINGEKVNEQTGPDEIEVEVREGKIKGASWLSELNLFLDEAERELRKSKRGKAQPSREIHIPTMSNDGSKKPPANKDAEIATAAPTKGGGGIKTTALIARN